MGNTEKNKCKLVTMFTMNFGYFLVELIVGCITNSTALVADSFHMLSDVAALIVAYFAVKMSPKKWSKNTYGWARAEVLGALVNAVFLIALCFSIFVDAIQRFFEPQELEEVELLLIVGGIGLLMNLVGLCVFSDIGHGHSHDHSHGSGAKQGHRKSVLTHSNRLTRMVATVEGGSADDYKASNTSSVMPMEYTSEPTTNSPSEISENKKGDFVVVNMENAKDEEIVALIPENAKRNSISIKETTKKAGGADQMNIRGVFLHVMADALGSVVVMISALVVYFTDWKYKHFVDPAMSIFMVILIFISTYPLFKESSLILLQSVPEHIEMARLESKLLHQVDGIMGVHELHVWQLAGNRIIATAHITCKNLHDYFVVAEQVKTVFHNEGIHSTTIQPEFPQQSPGLDREGEEECYLSCHALTTTADCSENLCCPPATPTGK